MRTELDGRMDAALAALTAPGGPLGVATVERDGCSLPIITTAPASLPAYFAHYCAAHHDTTFLVAGDERLTFAEVHAAAGRVARALIAGHGVGPGDRVGIAMRNSPAWIVLYMGILMAGGVATLLNAWWQAEELAAAIADADCAVIFADPPRADRLGAAGTPVVTIDDTRPLADALAGVMAQGEAKTPLPEMAGEDHATLLFTAGSTGRCKGALSDQRAVVQGVFSYLAQTLMMRGLAATPPVAVPATLLTLPLFHVTAAVPTMLQSFALGRKLVMMRRWDPHAAMRLIAAERITYFVGVPLMSFEILTHPDRAAFDLSTLTDISAGGAARPVEHVRRIHAEMGGAAPLIGYGLTETNAVGASNWRSNYVAKPGSVGRPAPLVEIAIRDDAGAAVPRGFRGEVCIRSICTIRGYWNDAAATRACITADGFVRTGDIGYLDDDGYLFIVDRKKDIIIRGGENIACQEVEAALYTHPAVAEAAVFGLSHERLGEVPGAVVHLRAGTALTAEALRAHLAQRIAAFKLPARIWMSAAPLPRLGTEKIDKITLRNAYAAVVS